MKQPNSQQAAALVLAVAPSVSGGGDKGLLMALPGPPEDLTLRACEQDASKPCVLPLRLVLGSVKGYGHVAFLIQNNSRQTMGMVPDDLGYLGACTAAVQYRISGQNGPLDGAGVVISRAKSIVDLSPSSG